MAAILLATQCPAVQVFSGSIYRNTAMDTTALVAPNVPGTSTFRQQVNQLGAVSDQGDRAGAGIIGVPDGPQKIVISTGSGLLLAVSAGYAMIGGPCQIATATTLAVPDNTGRVWIWFKQTGPTLTYTTSTTPPAGEVCLLGSCVTSGGLITSCDTSGVMYLRGGLPVRETADAGAPGDTPPSNVQFFAKTLGGFYFWTGSAYIALGVSIAAVIDSTTTLFSQIDDDERLFRQLLFSMVALLGEDVLTTGELRSSYDQAVSEA